ncbi:hypothetical protein LR48_Vigan07g164800 [Vigna angularis]|uniref:Uncharacterized protein n=1 Tax=Phaseolus angularis TaxID=3914 RepID=A0A0L9UZJ8_PHAAN|nr:hypothetical protein LR48_Vigan07g164800 [Vigna angularis]
MSTFVGQNDVNGCQHSLQLKGLVGTKSNFYIHVLVHHYIVNIYGSVNKHTFPTGFGPGVTAVFHRILYARTQK